MSPRAAFRASQVTQSQPACVHTHRELRADSEGVVSCGDADDSLADVENSGDTNVVYPEDPDGEDAVAAEAQTHNANVSFS